MCGSRFFFLCCWFVLQIVALSTVAATHDNETPLPSTSPMPSVPLSQLIQNVLRATPSSSSDVSSDEGVSSILLEDGMTKMLRKTSFPKLENSIPFSATIKTLVVFNQAGCKRLSIQIAPKGQPNNNIVMKMNVCLNGKPPIAELPDGVATRFYNEHPVTTITPINKTLSRKP
jgi:hypothetical protein